MDCATPRPALIVAVTHIVLMRAGENMVWVHARRNIATMQRK